MRASDEISSIAMETIELKLSRSAVVGTAVAAIARRRVAATDIGERHAKAACTANRSGAAPARPRLERKRVKRSREM